MQQISTKAFLAALLLSSPVVGAEPQYPAADFQPTTIFQDAALIAQHAEAAKQRAAVEQSKPSAAAPSAAVPSPSAAPAGEAQAAAAGAQAGGSPLTENFPVVLIALALVGFSFWPGKRLGSKAGEARSAVAVFTGGASGETGVAKYLKTLPGHAPETGVAKYLKGLPDIIKVPETGVAKYLKSLK